MLTIQKVENPKNVLFCCTALQDSSKFWNKGNNWSFCQHSQILCRILSCHSCKLPVLGTFNCCCWIVMHHSVFSHTDMSRVIVVFLCPLFIVHRYFTSHVIFFQSRKTNFFYCIINILLLELVSTSYSTLLLAVKWVNLHL